MLQIGYLIVCEDVIQERDRVLIQKPLPIINPVSIPGNFSFKIAFSMFENLKEDDSPNDNKLNVRIIDSKGNEIFHSGELIIETNSNELNNDKRYRVAEADMNLNNLELHNEGVHTISLTLNNNTKTIDIPVISKQKQVD